MNFSTDTWWIVGIVFSAALAIISFFLKRTISQTDAHDKDINEIKRTYVRYIVETSMSNRSIYKSEV